jgi:hypothetical protein
VDSFIFDISPDDFLVFSEGDLSMLAHQLVLVPALGALGGTVSVLARIPRLMEETKPNPVSSFFNGFSKPLIGAAFALFLYLLIQSQLLAIDLDRYDEKELFLALAFLAGFSERLIPDLVRRTEETVSTGFGTETDGDARANMLHSAEADPPPPRPPDGSHQTDEAHQGTLERPKDRVGNVSTDTPHTT